MLGWSRERLAEQSRVANATLADFEAGKRTPYDRTLADIRRALEEAGIEFIVENGGGPGVRLRKGQGKAAGASKASGGHKDRAPGKQASRPPAAAAKRKR
jgi:transcriptional regulator with XRE-family HTH domain